MIIEQLLEQSLIYLIENKEATFFYVGNQGNFDFFVRKVLKKLKNKYSHIDYAVALAYMPGVKSQNDGFDYTDTVYPECLGGVPRRYAIYKRNIWMIDQSDTVVTYVETEIGGASQFKKIAERKGKTVINLAEKTKQQIVY